MTAQIALHEWRRLRAALSFWILLALTQLIVAWLAFAQLEAFAEIAPQLKAGAATVGATDLVVMPTAKRRKNPPVLHSPISETVLCRNDRKTRPFSDWSKMASKGSGRLIGTYLNIKIRVPGKA